MPTLRAVSRVRELPDGGRGVEVEPERLAGFLDRFGAGHGGLERTEATPDVLRSLAADGWTASVPVPYGALADPSVAGLVAHLAAPRTVGLVLVRLGGYSVGMVRDGAVLASKTGSRLVHGRSAAGGTSQHRFARRRDGQARVALQAAADTVARVLLPRAGELDAVVLGGDAVALRTLAGDRRLTALLARAEERVLDVGEPRRAVLDECARRVRAVEVVLHPPGLVSG